MRVYHFRNEQYGLRAISERRLKIARISELNDPFELIVAVGKDMAERRALQKTRAALSEKFGLLCFSKNWRNPVQWSHYADRHRGLCLGFDVPDHRLRSVHYASRRPKLDAVVTTDPESSLAQEQMLRILTTKFSHWRYEQEVRLFTSLEEADERGLYFLGYSDELVLREVIVGHCSDVSRSTLSDALGDLRDGVIARKARLSFRKFAVVNQEKASLWR